LLLLVVLVLLLQVQWLLLVRLFTGCGSGACMRG
jgi:hypothetical protein